MERNTRLLFVCLIAIIAGLLLIPLIPAGRAKINNSALSRPSAVKERQPVSSLLTSGTAAIPQKAGPTATVERSTQQAVSVGAASDAGPVDSATYARFGLGAGQSESTSKSSGIKPAANMPLNMSVQAAFSAAIGTNIGKGFQEGDILGDWDGREDDAADHGGKLTDTSSIDPSIASNPNFFFTRMAFSEHTIANGFTENIFYQGDSIGNVYVISNGAAGDLQRASPTPTITTLNLPTVLNAFGTLNSDDQVVITGLAVSPVCDLGSFSLVNGSFGPDFPPGTIGEVVFVTFEDTGGGLRLFANGQLVRSGLLAFPVSDAPTPGAAAPPGRQSANPFPVTVGGSFGVFFSAFSNLAGVAVDDDGSAYVQQVDLSQFTGANIVKIASRDSATRQDRSPATNGFLTTASLSPLGGNYGTASGPANQINRFTNYSGTSTFMGNVTSLATGPGNVLYAAVSRSLNPSDSATDQATEGLFSNSASLGATPSMITSFADTAGTFSNCAATVPAADGIADTIGTGPTATTWRAFVLGNGPDLRGTNTAVFGTTANTLKLNMAIDYSVYSGLAVNEEGTVYVISGGAPANVGNNPSPNIGEILAFEDNKPADRRADYIDFRGDLPPNPPNSGGNVGDGDSDRFDHIYYQAPIDATTVTPAGLAGLSRGFLRYTNRLAPNAISPGVTLGQTAGQNVQANNSTTGTIFFDGFDPSHQVAGGDDQQFPFRGDDSDGGGTPPVPVIPPALSTALNGGFEYSFGGPSTCTWNGFFLNSNGNLTFGAGDPSPIPTLAAFRSGAPRIAPAWTRLSPDARNVLPGTFPVQALGFANINAFKVRWINVPETGSEPCSTGVAAPPTDINNSGASNTFGVTLYDDGTSIDENSNQPLNPANPIGNNAVPFDLQEGPTDLRFVRDAVSGAIVGGTPRRDGSGNSVDTYGRMDLQGTPGTPTIVGYSIGGLPITNPPALCELNLSAGARSAETGPGVIQGQTSSIDFGLIGEGTEGSLFEIFNSSDFDLRFEGNDPATASPAGATDLSKTSVGFFGIGCAPPPNPQANVIVPDPFATTPTTTGLINAIGPVTLNILGSGFIQNEVTTVCASGGEGAPRAGKTATTAATLSVDVDANSVPEVTLPLTGVTVTGSNSVRATLPTALGLPGSPFPLTALGGIGTVTVTTTFTAGENNVFGPFVRTSTAPVILGTRAPVVTSITPTSGSCGSTQNLALAGSAFSFTQVGPGPSLARFVTNVTATEIGNPSNVINATSFSIVDNNNINATFNFGGASSKAFLIQAVGNNQAGGPAFASRDMLSLPQSPVPAPPPLGNEAGNIINFSCGGEQLAFSSGQFSATEDVVTIPVTITRVNPGGGTLTVDFATSNGSANQVGDYTMLSGTVTFGPADTSKTINVPITEDSFIEPNEYLQILLTNATGGASVGPQGGTLVFINNDDPAPPAGNAIDDQPTFVNQHYHDFFSRQGDAAGVAFWTGTITGCGANPVCIETLRNNASAAFFLSIEFQETGGFVLRSQRAAFGKQSSTVTRYPYLPFLRDAQRVGNGVIIGTPGDLALLDANKQAYATSLVTSTAFTTAYPLALTASQYVDALFSTALVIPSAAERTAAITAFGGGGTAGRVAAFRSVTDSAIVRNTEYNGAFVLMQYYGYLRRDPDEPGYQFWLNKLNSFNGDFNKAEMVKAFLSSTEYRSRFGN